MHFYRTTTPFWLLPLILLASTSAFLIPTSQSSKTFHTSKLDASLRDLLNDEDHPKNKRPETKNYFTFHSADSHSKQGFPIREESAKSEEEEEMGMHVYRLGTFSFGDGRRLGDLLKDGDGGEAAADVSSDDSENGQASATVDSTEDTAVGSDAENITSKRAEEITELQPDNYNNRGVFISKHKFPTQPTSRSIAGSSAKEDGTTDDDATRSPKDDHDGALRTFSFASSTYDTTRVERSEGAGVSSKTIFKEKRMVDRLGTFSLAKQSPSSSSESSSNSIGPSMPIRKSSPDMAGGDNHGDRMSTFSFASTSPSSQSQDTSTESTKSTDDTSNSSSIQSSSKPPTTIKSLSSLASSLPSTTRNDRINRIKSQNDPRTLHPDGMNVPRLNQGGFVMSMSGREGKKNIFERIDGELGSTEEERAAANAAGGGGAANSASSSSFGSTSATGTAGNSEESKTVTDWGDLSEAMGVGKQKQNGNTDESSNNNDSTCFIGFDLGTSGARISIIEKQSDTTNPNSYDYTEVFAAALSWDDILHYDDAYDWRSAVDALLMRAKEDVPDVMSRVKAMCVSGTSATCLLLEKGTLDVSRVARMYNFDVVKDNKEGVTSSKAGDKSPAERVVELIERYVPEKHTARANTGSLAKLLLWNEEESLVDEGNTVKEMLCHQSDYISLSLMFGGIERGDCAVSSDWHNCLKLGYDVKTLSYPDWMMKLLKEGANIPSPQDVLPSKVVSPGEPMGVISPVVASKYGLPDDAVMVGGTTDSNAAFFAAAGAKPEFGLAVTSLGSTVALKQLSSTYVEDASKGVYSHRFPRFGSSDEGEEAWLIGGASNVGCAVLRQEEFSNDELQTLSSEIDPNIDSPLSYYPLTKKGERFPVADSEKEPILDPKPDDRKEYLHGILQAIGDVERDGYRTLGELGATPNRPTEVLTCGGGSKNDVWIAMRERRLRDICNEGQRIVVKKALNTEASYGAALLAAASFE